MSRRGFVVELRIFVADELLRLVMKLLPMHQPETLVFARQIQAYHEARLRILKEQGRRYKQDRAVQR